jgi:hypothetical protein
VTVSAAMTINSALFVCWHLATVNMHPDRINFALQLDKTQDSNNWLIHDGECIDYNAKSEKAIVPF